MGLPTQAQKERLPGNGVDQGRGRDRLPPACANSQEIDSREKVQGEKLR